MVCSRTKIGQDLFLCVHIWSKLPKMVYKEVLWGFFLGGGCYFFKFLLTSKNYYCSKLIIKIIEIEHNSSFHFHFFLQPYLLIFSFLATPNHMEFWARDPI